MMGRLDNFFSTLSDVILGPRGTVYRELEEAHHAWSEYKCYHESILRQVTASLCGNDRRWAPELRPFRGLPDLIIIGINDNWTAKSPSFVMRLYVHFTKMSHSDYTADPNAKLPSEVLRKRGTISEDKTVIPTVRTLHHGSRTSLLK